MKGLTGLPASRKAIQETRSRMKLHKTKWTSLVLRTKTEVRKMTAYIDRTLIQVMTIVCR